MVTDQSLYTNLNPFDLPLSIASWISDLSTVSSAAVTRDAAQN